MRRTVEQYEVILNTRESSKCALFTLYEMSSWNKRKWRNGLSLYDACKICAGSVCSKWDRCDSLWWGIQPFNKSKQHEETWRDITEAFTKDYSWSAVLTTTKQLKLIMSSALNKKKENKEFLKTHLVTTLVIFKSELNETKSASTLE